MRRLATEWNHLDAEGRRVYENIAASKALRDMHADDEANDAAQGPAQRPRCDLGLGDYQYPLTPELVCDPVYTAEFAANMEKWRLGLEEIIEHATDALPFQQTIYDKA